MTGQQSNGNRTQNVQGTRDCAHVLYGKGRDLKRTESSNLMNAKQKGNVETTACLMCAEGEVEIRQNARTVEEEVYE